MSEFWRDVALHPDVKPGTSLGTDFDWWSPLLASPYVHVVQGEHGGYFLAQLDPLGRVYDLHAAIKPAGWGRPASALLKRALGEIDWDLITATEVAANWRSRPPLSFGFRPAAPADGQFRTWILTRAAWEVSPARRRTE